MSQGRGVFVRQAGMLSGAIATAVVVAFLAAVPVIAAGQEAKPLVVKATIWPNLAITFSPATFRHGTVIFEVKNRAPQPHQFAINGVTSKYIEPRAMQEVQVKFKRKGTYSATLADCGYPSNCGKPDSVPTGYIKLT